MVYNQNQTQQVMGSDPSVNWEWLINNRIMKMNDAEAEEDWEKYYVYGKFVLQRLRPHMELSQRQAIESEFLLLQEYERKIREHPTNNETSKKNDIKLLRKGFIDAHAAYIFFTLPRAGLIQIEEEGEIDFSKMDFEVMKTLIKNRSGMKLSLEREDEKEIKTDKKEE
jgi:hypothetical protein